MKHRKDRPNFTFLWAIGALAALGWVFEPVIGQAIQTGGIIAGNLVVQDTGALWLRGAVTGLFVIMGLYEQATLARMERSSRVYRDVLETIPDLVWTASASAPRQFLSPQVERVFGHTAEDFARRDGQLWWEGVHPDDRPRVRNAFEHLFSDDAPYAVQYRFRRKDGNWTWVEERSVMTFVRDGVRYANGIVSDVTERKRAEESRRLADRFDPLTRLPGRDLLHDRLRQALAYARRHRHQVAVLFLGIAGLKEAADTLGHRVADPLLKQAADRLRRLVREEDTVARYDASHLVIVLPDIPEARHASRVTQAVIGGLDTVLEVQGQSVAVGANVGLSFFPADGDEPEALVKHAAAAMERSRRRGRNTYELYTADMHQAAVRRLNLEAALRHALERGELELHFQPQFDLATDGLVGLEALVRWNHPEAGQIPPGEFIPMAEENGLIVPIGLWVLRAACTQMNRWRRAGIAPARMAVNVSVRQLEDEAIVEAAARALKESGLPPADLELEITESALVRNAEEARTALDGLKALGVRLAVDDFGTGQAALAYLKRFPIDTLKIDRTFVGACADDAEDAAIVKALIAMAHNLRLRVVAEGVETEPQLVFLKAHGCDRAQGFLLGRPVPVDAVTELLAGGHPAGPRS